MTGRIEQLKQLATCTWDGNLISKGDRDELLKSGLTHYHRGWNWLSPKGIEYLLDLGLLKP